MSDFLFEGLALLNGALLFGRDITIEHPYAASVLGVALAIVVVIRLVRRVRRSAKGVSLDSSGAQPCGVVDIGEP